MQSLPCLRLWRGGFSTQVRWGLKGPVQVPHQPLRLGGAAPGSSLFNDQVDLTRNPLLHPACLKIAVSLGWHGGGIQQVEQSC